MLDGFARKPALGLTKKCQLMGFGAIPPLSPFAFRLADQTKVPRVDTALGYSQVLGDLSHELVPMEI